MSIERWRRLPITEEFWTFDPNTGRLEPGLIVGDVPALSRLVNHVHPDVVRHAWPGQGDALDALQRVARWSEGLFNEKWKGLLRGVLRLQIR